MSTYKPTKLFVKYVADHLEALLSEDISTVDDAIHINANYFAALDNNDKTYWIKQLETHIENEAVAFVYARITNTQIDYNTPLDKVTNVWILLDIAGVNYKNHKYDTATLYYEKAALCGNLIAKSCVANAFITGNGKPKDTIKGMNLLANYIMKGCTFAGYLSAYYSHQKNEQLDTVMQIYLQYYNTKFYSNTQSIYENIISLLKLTDEKDKLNLHISLNAARTQKRTYDKLEKLHERLTTIEEELYAPDNIGAKKVQQHFDQIKDSLDELQKV